ncbi:bifunctional aspartate kinase/homoserine dehydrogenase I [Breznakiella homolactica]|uniref:Bifunctional aspartate kinase/homoserine dehydrogenase I n=1 Tax=Breznakiella homolactica TaxID=2798577 RepID=A0A7T7XKC1_9SPIR|nr:bifunctional aspartate kinase/homoserine dehydrogenase I [Breznakiella homolactica]QQO08010.1 bifunctional aspartate kinase/homoserine dehydrogenase I [Breznakiella homolactica]
MLVLKFGGTSVGSRDAIGRIIAILNDPEHFSNVRVVVVSALSGVTDGLAAAAKKAAAGDGTYKEILTAMESRHREIAEAFLKSPRLNQSNSFTAALFGDLNRIMDGVNILGELSPRILDSIMSFGERLSACLLSHILCESGVPADYLDARMVIKTDSNYGAARYFPDETYTNIRSLLETRPLLQIATGFIAASSDGNTTTLGRGGSDLSAAIFGAAIGAGEVEIWTDVDGIMTADPRQVTNAFRIDTISYVEAMELSHFGAKVLHPPTIRPSLEKGIPIRIRNTFNPKGPGTRITDESVPSPYAIRGVSSIGDIALIRVQGSGMVGVSGFSSRLFGALARKKLSVILITQASSEYSICFAVLPEFALTAAAAIEEEFEREIAAATIEHPITERDLAIIAVVGSRMKSTSGISGKVFHALGRNGISVVAIAQGSSELNISAVIRKEDEAKALNAVHEAFFLAGVRSVNLFLVGIGLIGGTLLKQLEHQKEVLADQHKIRVNLVGVANSRKMAFDSRGLNPGDTGKILEDGEAFDLGVFMERMRSFNLPNSAFCDCTASDMVPAAYAEILRSAIPVVTPNKRANSGPYDYYRLITDYSKDRGIPYLYETTVCAGLPVISTLRDLSLSGDRVRRIEAVLSGTLSFIFNNFDGSVPFSALVREAKAKGYTEPDPRDDLNAMDAARKALILARECGMPLEFDNVVIEPILPPACFDAPDIESFFRELEKADGAFEKRRAAAAAAGRELRYVALIEEGSARLALREEPAESPFRSLVDSDNIVVVATDRYSDLPLVVKGPGAGAAVTAGGVFADIVRIARTLV